MVLFQLKKLLIKKERIDYGVLESYHQVEKVQRLINNGFHNGMIMSE